MPRGDFHLIMKNRTKHTEVAPPMSGLGWGCMPWDGADDSARRARNYLHNPVSSTGRSKDTNRNGKSSGNRRPGVWQRFVRQTLQRRSAKTDLAA
jgi:hypothetical protein